MQKLAFYIAKGIKRQCKTYVLALFRKESSEQEAKQRLHKFYFEQKHIQNYCCPLKLFIQNKLGLTLLTKYQPF